MGLVRNRHPLAGKMVTLVSRDPEYDGKEFRIEDYWENVYGSSWMFAQGNPAALIYAMHSEFHELPTDNEVVYGKIGYLGHIVHVSELGAEVQNLHSGVDG